VGHFCTLWIAGGCPTVCADIQENCFFRSENLHFSENNENDAMRPDKHIPANIKNILRHFATFI
jgi:hypothetical protein